MKKILLIIVSAFVFRLFLIAGFSSPAVDDLGSYEDSARIAKGEATFNQYCIGCHNFRQDGIEPQLGGLTAKVAASWIERFIKNPQKIINSGDKRAQQLFKKYKVIMPSFPSLKQDELKSIVAYMNTQKTPSATVLGILLLFLRIKVFESGMFIKIKDEKVQRGNMLMLFNNRKRFAKYLKCILVGVLIWFVVGILITFSPEFGKALGLDEPVEAGKAVMLAFSGQVAGDIVSGLMSQYFKSRKKAILIFLCLSLLFIMAYLLFPSKQLFLFYTVCVLLGFANGYWTLFVTIAAELFGTNLRSTVATTVPNFVRGALIPLTAIFIYLKSTWGIIYSALAVGIVSILIAFIALRFLDETFTKDLNYTEDNNS